MELLIYNKEHWMDSLTERELANMVKDDPKFQIKYDSRYQKGDIVEVREDGYWTGKRAKGFNKDAFLVISRPGVLVDRTLMDSDEDNDVTLKIRKHRVETSRLSFTDNKVEITEVEYIRDSEIKVRSIG